MNEYEDWEHSFPDLPGITAFLMPRPRGQSGYWLVVKQDDKVITKQFTSDPDKLDVREAVINILKDRARNEKIRKGICPDCGGQLTDNTYTRPNGKRAGNIECPTCAKTLVWL